MTALKQTCAALLRDKNLIQHTWCDARDGRRMDVSDPASGETIGSVPDSGAADALAAVDAAQAAFPAWAARPAAERARLLKRWHALILSNQEALGSLISLEQGKPLKEGIGEVLYGAAYVDWFAAEATRGYGDIIPEAVPGRKMMVLKEPVGVVAAI